MARLVSGHSPAVGRIIEALGNNTARVRRVVIDIRCDAAVMVYVQRFLTEDEIDPIAELLEGGGARIIEVNNLDVDEKGNVLVKPFAPPPSHSP